MLGRIHLWPLPQFHCSKNFILEKWLFLLYEAQSSRYFLCNNIDTIDWSYNCFTLSVWNSLFCTSSVLTPVWQIPANKMSKSIKCSDVGASDGRFSRTKTVTSVKDLKYPTTVLKLPIYVICRTPFNSALNLEIWTSKSSLGEWFKMPLINWAVPFWDRWCKFCFKRKEVTRWTGLVAPCSQICTVLKYTAPTADPTNKILVEAK